MTKYNYNPLVSVIVPFYNPDPCYFKKLLNSLGAQTYVNIEIILIDDGSNPKSHKIAKDFESVKDNVTLISQNNKGVSYARQKGVDSCNGQLIIFADADDIVPQEAIKNMVIELIASDSDIVIGSYTLLYSSTQQIINVYPEEDYWTFVRGLLDGKYHGSLWNKLIKKELYDSVSFETNISYMEDKLILSKILLKGPHKISFLNQSVYTYRQNNASITNNLSSSSINSALKVTDNIINQYSNIFDHTFLINLSKKARVFELIQKAKLGINEFTETDSKLLKDRTIPRKKRYLLWLLSKNAMRLVSVVFMFENKYKTLLLHNSNEKFTLINKT